MALDLMQENEWVIDDLNITFDNVMNLISGRISEKRLDKALNHFEIFISSDEKDGEADEYDFISIQQMSKDSSQVYFYYDFILIKLCVY